MKYLIRFDWQATREGIRGGLNTQHTDWEPFEADNWEAAKTIVGFRPEISRLIKPVHQFDGEYLMSIVVLEDKGYPFRMHSWNRPQ
jgi:hypothetical protein